MRGGLTGTVLLAAVLLLGACSSSDSEHRPRAVPSYSACFGCLGVPPGTFGPVVIKGAQRGGTVSVLTHDGLAGTLDPSEVRAPDVLSIDRGLLTRSLTQYRYDPTTGRMILVPDLATDLGEHNDDYTRWRYTVRRGARFEDGERVTASDVVRGIRRCQQAATFPTGPCQDVLGAALGSVRAVDQNGVELRFTEPSPDLPYLGTFPELGPVPAHPSLSPATYRLHPLATGPYRVGRYVPSRVLVLTRNPEWDPKTDPARTAYPDRYVFRSGVPAREIDRRVLAGTDSATMTYDAVQPADLAAVREAGRLVPGPRPCLTYWAPDNRLLTDRRVRLALAWAYPYRAMLRSQGLVPGVTAVPARNLEPPSGPKPPPVPVAGPGGFRTSPTRARDLLTRAGLLGQPLRFAVSRSDAEGRRQARTLSEALRRAGFAPQPVEPAGGLAARPGSKDVDVRTETWCAGYPSGGASVPALVGTPNLSRFSQRSVDRSIRAVDHLPLSQAPRAWHRLDLSVTRRWWPLVPLWYGRVAMAHGEGIHGMVDDAVQGMPDWKSLWVSS